MLETRRESIPTIKIRFFLSKSEDCRARSLNACAHTLRFFAISDPWLYRQQLRTWNGQDCKEQFVVVDEFTEIATSRARQHQPGNPPFSGRNKSPEELFLFKNGNNSAVFKIIRARDSDHHRAHCQRKCLRDVIINKTAFSEPQELNPIF